MLQFAKSFRMKIRKITRKSQLKTQEMAFMLMAVVIFFIIAGLFFIVIKYRELYRTAGLFEKEKALSTVAKLAETAEFSCNKPLCVDTDKLIVMQNRPAYNGFWPIASLSVVKIFPKQEEVECTKENYPNCSFFKVYDKQIENKEEVSTFVSLCRKEKQGDYWYEKCELGKLIAGFEIKQLQ